MAKTLKNAADASLNEKTEKFINRLNSQMHFKSEVDSNSLSFEWLKEIEIACPYLDNIIRNPRLTLINETDVVKIEKARKITVESVVDLSKHTQFIDKVDPITSDVEPSKIMILRREETFNTYENRLIYTLFYDVSKFMQKKTAELEEIKAKSDRLLEYAGDTDNGSDRINIELKVSTKKLEDDKDNGDFDKELKLVKDRVKRVNDYITSWRKSEFVKFLDKAHAIFVKSPITKTNMIIKNPNFQMAMKLWEFLQHYLNEEDSSTDGLDTSGNNILKGILDDTFLMDYFVLDSISSTKKEQKEKLSKYAIIMIKHQIQRAVSLLLNNGIKVSEEEILAMVSSEIQKEKEKSLIISSDVKNKFKNAMDEYLERTRKYL